MIWKKTGKQPDELANAPKCPPEAEYLWSCYREIAQDRQRGHAITAQMMRDYEWLEGVRLSLWERKAIKLLDRIYITRSYDDEGAA